MEEFLDHMQTLRALCPDWPILQMHLQTRLF